MVPIYVNKFLIKFRLTPDPHHFKSEIPRAISLAPITYYPAFPITPYQLTVIHFGRNLVIIKSVYSSIS